LTPANCQVHTGQESRAKHEQVSRANKNHLIWGLQTCLISFEVSVEVPPDRIPSEIGLCPQDFCESRHAGGPADFDLIDSHFSVLSVRGLVFFVFYTFLSYIFL
jgi:hypothetical protein